MKVALIGYGTISTVIDQAIKNKKVDVELACARACAQMG